MGSIVIKEVIIPGPEFRSQGDEDAFFYWLKRIPGVSGVEGVGTNLKVFLHAPATEDTANELTAILIRYGVQEMRLAEEVRDDDVVVKLDTFRRKQP